VVVVEEEEEDNDEEGEYKRVPDAGGGKAVPLHFVESNEDKRLYKEREGNV
jgi:hypothetical protein